MITYSVFNSALRLKHRHLEVRAVHKLYSLEFNSAIKRGKL